VAHVSPDRTVLAYSLHPVPGLPLCTSYSLSSPLLYWTLDVPAV
jgi:hypothetical protein